jgi:hypothetical protein
MLPHTWESVPDPSLPVRKQPVQFKSQNKPKESRRSHASRIQTGKILALDGQSIIQSHRADSKKALENKFGEELKPSDPLQNLPPESGQEATDAEKKKPPIAARRFPTVKETAGRRVEMLGFLREFVLASKRGHMGGHMPIRKILARKNQAAVALDYSCTTLSR